MGIWDHAREGANVLLSEWYNSHIVLLSLSLSNGYMSWLCSGKNINVVRLSCTGVSVSLPTTVSVAEGAGMVEVCATLSGPDIMRTDIPISVFLETADGKTTVFSRMSLKQSILCFLFPLYDISNLNSKHE